MESVAIDSGKLPLHGKIGDDPVATAFVFTNAARQKKHPGRDLHTNELLRTARDIRLASTIREISTLLPGADGHRAYSVVRHSHRGDGVVTELVIEEHLNGVLLAVDAGVPEHAAVLSCDDGPRPSAVGLPLPLLFPACSCLAFLAVNHDFNPLFSFGKPIFSR